MQGQGAVEEPGAGAAGAVLLQRLDAGGDDVRVHREAQVVVAAQHDAALALHDDLGVLAGLQCVEVGIDALFPQLVGQRIAIALFEDIQIKYGHY